MFVFLLQQAVPMAYVADLSKLLSRMIDRIVCNQRIIHFRKAVLLERDEHMSKDVGENYKKAGSRKDGISNCLESGLDEICVISEVLCIEEGHSPGFPPEICHLLIMEPSACTPGYCQLRLTKNSNVNSEKPDDHGLVPLDWYLLSSVYRRLLLDTFKAEFGLSQAGPALRHFDSEYGDEDRLSTLRIVCPTILNRWLNRPRYHDWPPLHVRQQIVDMGGNLVTAGGKDSRFEDSEWGYCFNDIEILLVVNLNDTQMKLYKVLKMIKTDMLERSQKTVTSCMIKNIVLCLAERFPSSMFEWDTLYIWVIKALKLLKRSIRMYFPPYYMIPERNLLVEKLHPSKCEDIVCELNAIIHAYPAVLFKLKKLEIIMNLRPVELLEFREKRGEFEMLYCYLESLLLNGKQVGIDGYESTVTEVGARLETLLHSHWPDKIHRQFMSCSKRTEKFNVLIS